MKKLISWPLALVFILLFASCEKDDEWNLSSLVKRQWIESHKENTPEGIQIYRTGTFEDFPPSWYRQVFYFDDNNECEYRVLAPHDGHYMAKGSWDYNEESKVIRIYNSDSEEIFELTIVELRKNVLKLKEEK